jgi:hypothetical protein
MELADAGIALPPGKKERGVGARREEGGGDGFNLGREIRTTSLGDGDGSLGGWRRGN